MLRIYPVHALAASIVIGIIGSVLPVAAQPPADSIEQAKRLLRQAHATSLEADTLQQYTEVIRLCERVSSFAVTEDLHEYERKLRAWAHNQRGEHYHERAGSSLEAGRESMAAQWDDQALREFETAVELNPDYWKALHNRGVCRAVQRQWDGAHQDFSRVVEMKPDYVHGWFNRAEVQMQQQRFAEAVEDYTRAIELDPEDPVAFKRRGQAHIQLREFQHALSDLDRAVELSPNDADALVSRAEVQRRLARWQAAADDYSQAIYLDNESGSAYQGAAWLMATCPDSKLRNTDLALRAARQAFELLGPEDYRGPATMAAALAQAGDFAKAVERQNEAIQLAPPERLDDLQQRLEQYQQQQPYREP